MNSSTFTYHGYDSSIPIDQSFAYSSQPLDCYSYPVGKTSPQIESINPSITSPSLDSYYTPPLSPLSFASDQEFVTVDPFQQAATVAAMDKPDRRQSHSTTSSQGGSPRSSSARVIAKGIVTEQDLVADRRRAQNRASQRAFRARKLQRSQELENQLHELQEKYRLLEVDHKQLESAYQKLRESIDLLMEMESKEGAIAGHKADMKAVKGLLEIVYRDVTAAKSN